MKVLALDTSTNLGGVSVVDGHSLLAERSWRREGSHGELLTPAIESALEEARLRPLDLEALAVGIGPGSFTGVRVAINAARSLSYALGLKIFAFDTTEILVSQVPAHEGSQVAILQNAYGNRVFASTFVATSGVWTRVLKLDAYFPEELSAKINGSALALGDGFQAYEATFGSDFINRLRRDPALIDEPQATWLSRLAVDNPDGRQPLVWNALQALYIRASGAEEKLREDRASKA